MNSKQNKTLTVKDLLEILKKEFSFEVNLLSGKKGLKNRLSTLDVNRPGVTLAGYFKNFASDRIQLFGRGEFDYITSLSNDKQRRILEKFFSYKIPCCFFINNDKPGEVFIDLSNEAGIPLISVNPDTRQLNETLHEVLEKHFAPRSSYHGVMVEVFGIGVLILGKSGVGKSECALDLLTRNHRLIGDDVVIVSKLGGSILVAQGPELIKYHIEIRGIGIIDVQRLFGVGSVREKKRVDIVVRLEEWDKDKKYERIGIDNKYYTILGVKVPLIEIPVKPGRNIPVIIETAVRNIRLRHMGINSSELLNARVQDQMRFK
ncbi:MAG: HPr(Ser) kinase/phosphatase [Spirochaetes bacterium]|nr:HPr(Ser) kinase/phosphatase [Spirochaetota bacterium]